MILKLRGETCDIDCVYCFEKRKVAPGGRTITPDQVGRLETLFPGRKIAIELHGGEPLTAPQAEMAAILDTLAATEAVIKVHLQTNGVRLTADWLDLFDAHYPALGIGISLDGDEDGNSWRVGYDDQPVYPKVAAALDLLHTRGRTCGIVTVVTPAVLGRAAETLDHLARFPAVRAVNFVPAFDFTVTAPIPAAGPRTPPSRLRQGRALASGKPDWAITPEQYDTFVLEATAHWIAAGHHQRLKLDPAVSVIRNLKGVGSDHCHFSGQCEPHGTVRLMQLTQHRR